MVARIVVAAAVLFTSVSFGDQVAPAEAAMAPLIFQDSEGYTGCGLRVLVVFAGAGVTKGGEFSVSLFTRPTVYGLMKAGGMRCTASCESPDDLKYSHGSDYMISSLKDGVPVKVIKAGPADEPEFTLMAIDGEAAITQLMNLRTGQRMQFAYKPDGTAYRESFTFTAPTMTSDEQASFDACLEGALKE